MTYTCACFPTDDRARSRRRRRTSTTSSRGSSACSPGMRLLDVGCGWGGMVRHAVEALRRHGPRGDPFAASRPRGRRPAIEADGLADRAEVRHGDYRDVTERGFDAISSIGLTEHVGVANYPAYFRFLRERLRDEGRLLNHCITRPGQPARRPALAWLHQPLRLPRRRADGQRRHRPRHGGRGLRGAPPREPPRALRPHVAAWSANLAKHWDDCVDHGRSRDGPRVGSLPRRVATGLRAQRDPAAPGAGVTHERRRGVGLRAAAALRTVRL